jgi:hypothetical protein
MKKAGVHIHEQLDATVKKLAAKNKVLKKN